MPEKVNYNPDILSCLANLSSDEVFTPPEIANAMLDTLPQELFHNPDTKFLDPGCKSGVFLREIAKRLNEGLKDQIPDVEQRMEHIMKNQLFGIAITQITALLSRRRVYCSKDASGEYAVVHFNNPDGNIRYRRIEHTWVDGRCSICGASREVQDRGEDMESHAYELIHMRDDELKELRNMKFDVIIGNPPYQLNVGVEKENYAVPIYQKFVEQAKKLNPRYLSMIIPARWYAGGRGLEDFRDATLNDNRFRILHDYPESMDCFPGVEIQAGVCYFLWERDNPGDCFVTSHAKNVPESTICRPLLEKDCTTFIRYNESVSILRKVYGSEETFLSFSSLVSPQTPFGLVTSYKGIPTRDNPSDIKMYISGNEKEFKGGSAFVPDAMVTKGRNMIPWHKVYIGEAYGGGMAFPHSILSKPFYGEPQTVCNQSYLVLGSFKNKTECNNVMSYISTKFFRFMVLQKKNAQHAMRGVYQFVPMQDFSKPWTDAELYKKYALSPDEIAFIESMIKPMDLGGSDA